MKVYFPGGKRISADYKGFTIETDQSLHSGGEGLHPNAFDLFKASLGTCIGYYVMRFCQEREISLDCIRLDVHFQEAEYIQCVDIKIIVDQRFPQKYLKSVIKATEACKIKKQLLHPPIYKIKTLYSSEVK